jgi:hypothetical protein
MYAMYYLKIRGKMALDKEDFIKYGFCPKVNDCPNMRKKGNKDRPRGPKKVSKVSRSFFFFSFSKNLFTEV